MVFADIIIGCSFGTSEGLEPLDFGIHGHLVKARPFTLGLHPCFIVVASEAAFTTKDMLKSYFASTALDTAASRRDFLGTTASSYSACVGAFPFEASHHVAFDWGMAHYFNSLSFYF